MRGSPGRPQIHNCDHSPPYMSKQKVPTHHWNHVFYQLRLCCGPITTYFTAVKREKWIAADLTELLSDSFFHSRDYYALIKVIE